MKFINKKMKMQLLNLFNYLIIIMMQMICSTKKTKIGLKKQFQENNKIRIVKILLMFKLKWKN